MHICDPAPLLHQKCLPTLSMIPHTYDPYTEAAPVRRQGIPAFCVGHRETLSQRNKIRRYRDGSVVRVLADFLEDLNSIPSNCEGIKQLSVTLALKTLLDSAYLHKHGTHACTQIIFFNLKKNKNQQEDVRGHS